MEQYLREGECRGRRGEGRRECVCVCEGFQRRIQTELEITQVACELQLSTELKCQSLLPVSFSTHLLPWLLPFPFIVAVDFLFLLFEGILR